MPFGGPPDAGQPPEVSAKATDSRGFEASNGAFTIDLPNQWNDLTADYTAEVPDTVMAAFWSTGTELGAPLTPFATVSTRPTVPGEDVAREVDEDMASWSGRMSGPEEGVATAFETEAGGRGVWRAVRGKIDGLDTTIYSIHIIDGSTKMMVLIESYMDITDPVAELLGALKTVRFPAVAEPSVAPAAEPGRTAAPEDESGRWFSYCRTVSIAIQDEWVYSPQEGLDGTPWVCPEDTDYLGAWIATTPAGQYFVMAQYQAERTVEEARAEFSIPTVVGQAEVTPNGFTMELLDTGSAELANGMKVSWVEVKATTPEGFDSYTRSYGVDLGGSTSIEFLTQTEANEPGGDYEWLLEALESLEVG